MSDGIDAAAAVAAGWGDSVKVIYHPVTFIHTIYSYYSINWSEDGLVRVTWLPGSATGELQPARHDHLRARDLRDRPPLHVRGEARLPGEHAVPRKDTPTRAARVTPKSRSCATCGLIPWLRSVRLAEPR